LLSAVQTMTSASPMTPLTTAGAVIGTIQYMAPEQIEGKEADARSDLFALGAVLYEMITGTRPFEGKSQISVASAILEKDPEPISKLLPLTPPAFEHVVTACLAKNPDDRFQAATDVKLELKWIAETPPPVAAEQGHPGKASSRLIPWIIAAAAIALLAAGSLAFLLHKTAQPRYRMVSYRDGTLQAARFSRDGQTIVYSGQWEGQPPEVAITRADSPESRPLGIPSATVAAVSSTDELAVIEGCELVFLLNCAGNLATVNLAGGAPRQLAANVTFADWSPDSKQLAIVVDSPNDARLEYPPGHILYQQNSGWLGHPRFSPDGTLIAFENHPTDSDDGSIDVIDMQGKRRIITQGWLSIEGIAWHPSGKEIWFAGTVDTGGWADAIHAVSLSGKDRILLTMPWVRLHDISRDGHVLLSRENWRRQMVGKFPKDSAEHPYSWLDSSTPDALSNDGEWLSFREAGEVYYIAGDSQAYYRKTDGSPAISLGGGQGLISPDGKSILTFGRKSKMMLQSVGIGESKQIPTPGLTGFDHAAWSDDGRMIAYEGLTAQNEWNVYTQKIDGGPPTLVKSQGRNAIPTLSADGSILALDEEHRGIFLYHAGSSQPEALKGVLPTERPIRFANGDRSLLVASADGREVVLTLIDIASGRRQIWNRLPSPSLPNGKGVAITPDLKYYAYEVPRYSSNLYLVENLR
jgi:eukaryotic-like serine/threonine-protein kinase